MWVEYGVYYDPTTKLVYLQIFKKTKGEIKHLQLVVKDGRVYGEDDDT